MRYVPGVACPGLAVGLFQAGADGAGRPGPGTANRPMVGRGTGKAGVVDMNRRCERDVIEDAVVKLRACRSDIEKNLPAKVILHMPPSDSREDVVVELHAKLRR